MVTLTEVEDEHFQHAQAGPDVEEDDEDYSDTGKTYPRTPYRIHDIVHTN